MNQGASMYGIPSASSGSQNASPTGANNALGVHGFTVGGVLTVLGIAVLVALVLNMLNFRFALAVRR